MNKDQSQVPGTHSHEETDSSGTWHSWEPGNLPPQITEQNPGVLHNSLMLPIPFFFFFKKLAVLFIYLLLAMPHCMGDFSSLVRDRTHAFCLGSTES